MDHLARRAALALLSLAAIWGVALPWLACARESTSPVLAMTGRAALALGRGICHQRPERSFFNCGVQWPVCGRCSGLYMGAAAGAMLVLALGRRASSTHMTPDGAVLRWRRILLVAAAPTAALWVLEVAGLVDPGNAVRFAGALPLGLTVSTWLAAVAREDLR